MAHDRTAIVVGAGIGGLTAAVALRRRRWDATVLERATSLEPVGAGIALAPNAVRALESIGLGDPVLDLAALQGPVGLRRPDGRWLVRGDASMVGPEPTVLLHRSQLVDLLRGALDDGAVRLGVTVTRVDPGGPSERATVRVRARDDSEEAGLAADVVVAADGIDSPVRTALFPGQPGPVYAGATAWRFVTPEPVAVEPAETWGRGSVVGLTPLADGRVYCYLTATLPEGTRFRDEVGELQRRFGHWHPPLRALLGDLDPATLLHHDLRWLKEPLPRYDVGRVALLGDAAHAMTPHLGQGGAQAIEDAVVLAANLRAAPGSAAVIGPALAAYTAARKGRTQGVARMSAQVGAATTWRSPLLVGARDLGMRAVGRWVLPRAARRLDWILDWQPPVA
ncbi:monooxygenase [Luteimicrobium album]|uniref:Monooxygenase n=1 Tax=Luteimicrobium album TaxID=1054550 RepID=A0ABQ6HZL4_9MICO|nr:FAD-dependent monooxygenase [Luteimicrobium album]GMA23632.1 monooxygenase [Luteimicrobium album]